MFGKIDALEFASDAASLRTANEVFAQVSLDEKEFACWPKDGSVPASLRECCIATAETEAELSEAPGTEGPVQMTSHGETADVSSCHRGRLPSARPPRMAHMHLSCGVPLRRSLKNQLI